jgi:hypothetical protein
MSVLSRLTANILKSGVSADRTVGGADRLIECSEHPHAGLVRLAAGRSHRAFSSVVLNDAFLFAGKSVKAFHTSHLRPGYFLIAFLGSIEQPVAIVTPHFSAIRVEVRAICPTFHLL